MVGIYQLKELEHHSAELFSMVFFHLNPSFWQHACIFKSKTW